MHLATALFCCLTLLCLKIAILNVVGVVGVTRKTLGHAKLKNCDSTRTSLAGKKTVSKIDRFKKIKRHHVLYQDMVPSIKDSTTDKLRLLDLRYYFTLYDTEHKLPVYSAYTLDFHRRKECNRIDGWIVNFQMKRTEQPKLIDYKGIGGKHLHRGHLFPQFYNHGGNQMRFTNLITNIALQYEKFNTNAWHRLEKEVRLATIEYCSFGNAKRYFVTGVIPSNPSRKFKDINIPAYFWTAVCCDSSTASQENKRSSGWSFAYIAKNTNTDKSIIHMYPIKAFLKLSIIGQQFKTIFENTNEVKHCLFSPNQAAHVVLKIEQSDNIDKFIMHNKVSSLLTKKLAGVKRVRTG